MPELWVVVVLFTLSLAAAWVLFRILKSTAAIARKEYQLGGAAAGFLVIYSALYYSYDALAKLEVQSYRQRLAGCEQELPIRGTVVPPVRNATVVLAVKTVNLPDNGRFGLSAKGVDPKKDAVAIYVIAEKGHGYYQLFPEDDISNLKIDLTQAMSQER